MAFLSTVPTFSVAASGMATTPSASMTTGMLPLLPMATLTTHAPEALSLPAKLVKKIQDLEFVEMSELLTDSWRFQEDEAKCCHQRKGQRRGPITDILIWVECYSSLVATLSQRYPDKTPHLMAYMKTIVKAQRTFVGEGWVTYDACYRRKAAAAKTLDWGIIDFTLYNETFTGRAKALARCRYCSSDLHPSHECRFAPTVPVSGGGLPNMDTPPFQQPV